MCTKGTKMEINIGGKVYAAAVGQVLERGEDGKPRSVKVIHQDDVVNLGGSGSRDFISMFVYDRDSEKGPSAYLPPTEDPN